MKLYVLQILGTFICIYVKMNFSLLEMQHHQQGVINGLKSDIMKCLLYVNIPPPIPTPPPQTCLWGVYCFLVIYQSYYLSIHPLFHPCIHLQHFPWSDSLNMSTLIRQHALSKISETLLQGQCYSGRSNTYTEFVPASYLQNPCPIFKIFHIKWSKYVKPHVTFFHSHNVKFLKFIVVFFFKENIEGS